MLHYVHVAKPHLKLSLYHDSSLDGLFIAEAEANSDPVPKVPKGAHSSKDAYMLVYTRRVPEQEGICFFVFCFFVFCFVLFFFN
jgi:hypothetical protein